MTTTKAVSLPDQFQTAIDLVARVNALKAIKTKAEYEACEDDYKTLITNEKKLKIQFDELEIVKEYSKVYDQFQALKYDFATAKKHIKNGPMLAYDNEQERIRLAEQARLAEIARKEQEAETARLVEIQRQEAIKAEAARLAAELEAKKAEAARLKAQKAGNEKAAAEAAERAEAARKVAAEEAAKKEAARVEALAVKEDAKLMPATVILEKTHQGVSRRKVYRYRLTAKDGTKYLKADLTTSVRLGIKDLGVMPAHLFVLSPVLLNAYVDEQGEAAAIPGILEIKSEMV